MSKAKSTGSAQLAARMCGVPSHRSHPSQSQPATGPAPQPSPGTTLQPPPGYTAKKDGKVITFRREGIGEDAAPLRHPSRVSCHEHRAHLHEASSVETTGDDRRVSVPGRPGKQRSLVLPMRVTPHNWRPRGL